MPSRLCRLLYRSKLHDSVSWSDIVNIASHARVSNEENGITGMILSNDRDILQVIEGRLDNLNVLFNKIVFDNRHYQIELLSFETIPERSFDRWKMKEINLSRYKGDMDNVMQQFLIKPSDDCASRFFPHDAMKCLSLLSLVQATTSSK